MSNELTQLFPQGKEITIEDKSMVIKPFRLGDLPKVFKLIEPLTGPISAMMASPKGMASIVSLLAEGGDSVLDLMAVGSRQPRAWIDTLEMDDGATLLLAVIEVNADFFIRKALPMVNAKMAQIAGQTSS